MLIYTSSWKSKLPPNLCRISVSRGTPKGDSNYKIYRALAPGPWFMSVDQDEYRRLYFEILGKLDPHKVVGDLARIADGKTPALLCFEGPRPGKNWCHRGLISAWLYDRLGLEVFEWGQEKEGCGWSHPKLPPAFRRASALLQTGTNQL